MNAQIPATARSTHEAANMSWQKIGRVFSGSFSTSEARKAAVKELQTMEALTRDLRRALRAPA